MQHSKLYKILGYGIMFLAYAYLLWVLLSYNNYETLLNEWSINLKKHSLWLIGVFLLLPLNWFLESLKWKILTQTIEKLSIRKAFISVMGGNVTAFFTPNRIGEFPGRCAFLSERNRVTGMSLGIVGSMSQTLVIMLCGVPAALLYFSIVGSVPFSFGVSFATVSFVLLTITYFFLPELFQWLLQFPIFRKIERFLSPVFLLKKQTLLTVLLIAVGRYAVFCTQFYCMLQFFDINLTPFLGIICIATNYLFITFTPCLAFSEGAVRASIATLVFTAVSANSVGVVISGISIWLINFVIPMLIGTLTWKKFIHQKP